MSIHDIKKTISFLLSDLDTSWPCCVVSVVAFTTLVLAVCGASKALRQLVGEGQQWWKLLKPIFPKRKASGNLSTSTGRLPPGTGNPRRLLQHKGRML